MSPEDSAAIVLRALTYWGAIAVAGGMLSRLGFARVASEVAPTLRWQIAYGFVLLLVVEPLRYGVFQLTIADGDWALAFGPDMRWMGLATPIGQAAIVRLAAAALVAFAGLRVPLLGLAGALVLIGSFLIEGHTAADAARLLLAPLLFLHLASVCWWIGALLPLLALTHSADHHAIADTMREFGHRAAWVVAALVIAGAGLAIVLTGGVLQLDSAYQLRLLLKLVLVAGLLALAAMNKLWLTPLLATDPARAVARLRLSIGCELALALAILAATAWLVATSPIIEPL